MVVEFAGANCPATTEGEILDKIGQVVRKKSLTTTVGARLSSCEKVQNPGRGADKGRRNFGHFMVNFSGKYLLTPRWRGRFLR